MKILVFAKQVMDPETPQANFKIDPATNKALPVQGAAPVINGFDEQAVEAALRIKDKAGASITVITLGKDFVMDVVKKPLSMGADELVLIQDDSFDDSDSSAISEILAAAAKKIGSFDLVLCGRQASDTDRGQVGPGIADLLGLPCATLAKSIEVADGKAKVQRVRSDGTEVVEMPLPAVVSISNELGEPRYPTLRGIMMAGRKQPIKWSLKDLNAAPAAKRVKLLKLYIPIKEKKCEVVEGENAADAGRKLALKLREVKLI